MGPCVYSGQGAIEKAWVKTLSSDLQSSIGRARPNLRAYVAKALTAIREVSALKTQACLCTAFQQCDRLTSPVAPYHIPVSNG